MDPVTLEDVPDGEVWDLHESTFGRSCNRHECCGKSLRSGELLRFRKCHINAGDVHATEEVIMAIRIEDGTEMCKVGFLPKRHVLYDADKYDGKEAQVILIYDEE